MKSLGFDIGGTKIEAAIVEDGTIMQHLHEATQKSDIAGQILRMAHLLDPSLPVGVGIAGQIQEGVVTFSPNLALNEYPLKKLLEEKLSGPITVINDVQAAGYAEWKWGAGKEAHRLVVAFLGTGIGGALMSDGNLYRGTAGEFGHMVIHQNGLPCTCGREGCLEAYAGGWALARNSRKASAKELFAGGSSLTLDHALDALVTGFSNLVNIFNPDKMILGGGLLKGYQSVFPNFVHDLERRIKEESLLAASHNFKLVEAHFRESAPLLGAAALAITPQ